MVGPVNQKEVSSNKITVEQKCFIVNPLTVYTKEVSLHYWIKIMFGGGSVGRLGAILLQPYYNELLPKTSKAGEYINKTTERYDFQKKVTQEIFSELISLNIILMAHTDEICTIHMRTGVLIIR